MIRRLEEEGWTFAHWTDVPRPELAVMTNGAGEALYVDDNGNVLLHAASGRSKPLLPLAYCAPG